MKTNGPALRSGFLILASMAVGTSVLPAQTQELAGATTTPAVISSVAILQGALQRARVRVEGEGRLDARAARMQNPDRLVLDFNGARLGVQKTGIPGVLAPVLGVRLGQFRTNVVRVVIDLTEAAHFQLAHDGTAVVVMFNLEPGVPTGTVEGAATMTSGQNSTAHGEFRYSNISPRELSAVSAKKSRITSPRFALPGELTQPSFALASFGGKSEPA